MKAIYKLSVSDNAPALIVTGKHASSFLRITGQEKIIDLSPTKSFSGEIEREANWTSFYSVCPGAFAVSESTWENCEDMYYEIAENNIELISVVTPKADMRVIIPKEIREIDLDAPEAIDLSQLNGLFRVHGEELTQIFCNQAFYDCYHQFDFDGLEFTKIKEEA